MTHLGFVQRWRNWVSALWATSSSSILLNGQPGKKINHCRGVRQGDPFSPLLFLLAMEPLHRLLHIAQQRGLFLDLSKGCKDFRISMYADDAAVFIKPTEYELEVLEGILKIFSDASGLKINANKTECFPIRCDQIDLSFVTAKNMTLSSFPCTYLGLPLNTRNPKRNDIHKIVQKVGGRLPGWVRRFFSYPGRDLLIKSVLTSLPTYFMTVFKMPRWAIHRIDRYRRSFLWRGKNPEG